MAQKRKPRQKSGEVAKPKRPSPTEQKMIWQIETLLDEEQFEPAFVLLTQMLEEYPTNAQALNIMCDLSLQMGAWPLFIMYGERLKEFVQDEEIAPMLNNLMYAYGQMQYPAIVLQLGNQLLSEYPDIEGIGKIRHTVMAVQEVLLHEANNIPALADQAKETIYRFYLRQDQLHYETIFNASIVDSEQIADEMLQIVPNYVPALNNMSRIYYQQGEVDKAFNYANQVLEQEPQNMIALSNLIEYQFFEAQFEQAKQHLKHLQRIISTTPEVVASQIKASALLGDDRGIIDAYKLLKQVDEYNLPPMALHWVGTAYCRLGKEDQARRFWEKAVEQGYFPAQDCLDDLEVPKAERHADWYWPFSHWITGKMHALGDASLAPSDDDAAEKLLKEWPQLPMLFPYMLSFGDAETREFVLALIEMISDPTFAPSLTTFVHSQHGTQEQRDFAQTLLEDLTSGDE